MKSLVTFIAVIALTATAYGQVTVGVADQGDGTGIVQITAVGGGQLSCVGISLIVDASLGATVDSVVGVAPPASPFFDVYIDFYNTNPGALNDNNFADDGGNPGANPNAAGALTAGPAVSLSMGELNTLDANSLSLPIDLAIIDLGAAGDVCISIDTLRGGIVDTAGGAVTLSNPGACFAITATPPDCFPTNLGTQSTDRLAFLAAGKFIADVDCWCGPYHCRGDINNAPQGFGGQRIGTVDLPILIANWQTTAATITDACADINHKAQGFGGQRVGTIDLGIFVANWQKTGPQMDTEFGGVQCPIP